MKVNEGFLRPKIILLVKIFVLQQLGSLFWRIYAFMIIGQLQHNTVVGYGSYYNIVFVYRCGVFSVSVCVNK